MNMSLLTNSEKVVMKLDQYYDENCDQWYHRIDNKAYLGFDCATAMCFWSPIGEEKPIDTTLLGWANFLNCIVRDVDYEVVNGNGEKWRMPKKFVLEKNDHILTVTKIDAKNIDVSLRKLGLDEIKVNKHTSKLDSEIIFYHENVPDEIILSRS